jgi:signal-induced proliferation-associated 1 like protein 3
MQAELNIENVGDINEGGFLANLNKQGLDHAKCLMELHANCIDAGATHIKYDVSRDKIKLIDAGENCGMDMPHIKKAFSMYNSNHSNEQKMGVSGYGMKPGLNNLSDRSLTLLVTKSQNGPYLTAECPWGEMHRLRQYTGMIRIRSSTEEEIEEFNNDRLDLPKSGTTHIFKYTSKLADSIAQQFETPDSCENFDPINQFSVVFGLCPQIVMYRHYEYPQKILNGYNYFDAEESKFYTGIKKYRINCLEKIGENDRFILQKPDGEYEIKPKGNKFATKMTKITSNYDTWTSYGEFELCVGARYDESYFDDKNPKLPGCSAIIHPYDQHHIGNNFDWLCSIPLRRNDQLIGVVKPTNIKISSARGTPELMNIVYNTHMEIRYYPVSSIDNKQDALACVQQCKTTCNPMFPITLQRIFENVKHDEGENIWKYFEDKYKSRPVEEPVENPVIHIPVVPIQLPEVDLVENPVIHIPVVPIQLPEVDLVENPVIHIPVVPIQLPEVDLVENPVIHIPVVPIQLPEVDLVENPVIHIPVVPIQLPEVDLVENPVIHIPVVPIQLPEVDLVENPVIHIHVVPIQLPEATKTDIEPVDVYSYRRGGVLGSELQEESLRLCSRLIPEKKYTDEYIQLLNLLRKINGLE